MKEIKTNRKKVLCLMGFLVLAVLGQSCKDASSRDIGQKIEKTGSLQFLEKNFPDCYEIALCRGVEILGMESFSDGNGSIVKIEIAAVEKGVSIRECVLERLARASWTRGKARGLTGSIEKIDVAKNQIADSDLFYSIVKDGEFGVGRDTMHMRIWISADDGKGVIYCEMQ